jgi:aspartyl-tRNA(Asn)/glutamyl-tRNA(Gln) amidotransferase subunit C
MSAHLAQVLDYIDLLQQLDMSDIAPLAHPAELRDVFAEDVPLPSLNRDAALGNAPQRDDECFLVPAVMAEGS